MSVLLWIIVMAVVVASIFYLLHVPIPEGLDSKEQSFYRFMFYFTNVYFRLGRLYSYVNGKPYVVNCRIAGKAFLPKPKQDVHSHIQVSTVFYGEAKVRQYRNLKQTPGKKCPALIYIHGGGYVLGHPRAYDNFLRSLCDELGCYIAALYYPLAPEHTFPGPYQHCFDASKWFLKNCHKFLVDPTRVAIAGDSAGGQLAASVVQDLAKDHSVSNVKLQILIYAPFQWLDMNSPSYQEVKKLHGSNITVGNVALSSFVSFYLTGREDWAFVQALSQNKMMSNRTRNSSVMKRIDHGLLSSKYTNSLSYEGIISGMCDRDLSTQFEDLLLDYRLSPITGDVAGVPMAYVVSCGLDCLRDDSFWYCMHLENAGVRVVHKHYKTGIHGMLTFPEETLPLAGEMRRNIVLFLKENL